MKFINSTRRLRHALPARIWQRTSLGIWVCLTLSACGSLPQPVNVDFAEPAKVQAIVAPPTGGTTSTGSLFNKVSYRPAFEDVRARAVGDTVTIQIVERVTASQVSSSTANRTTSSSAAVSAFPVIPVGELAKLAVGTSSESDFSGDGATQSANTFTGSITATVAEVLPNGHLVVKGEKQIGVNQNVDVLRFSGTVDPRVLQPGSIVNSTQVANARIESKGRGAQAEAQTVGWLTRFFFSFLPF
jgi:flagellar L-ring protein precursor FlgH